MNIPEIARVTKDLLSTQEMHKKKAAFYHQLFNANFPDDVPTTTYTPLQEFYQRRAEYHLSEAHKIDASLQELQDIAEFWAE